jgi:lysyl-tRNA synthetase class 2
LGTKAAEKVSYGNLFIQHAEINPHTANLEELVNCLRTKNIFIDSSINIQDKDTTLQLLLTHLIEPKLGEERPCLVYDFPVSQAALARIRDDDANHPTAARFEVYFKGIELANGFYELQDVNEQRKRFEKNILERQQLALESLPIDDYFLAALQHGLPDCSGVALGVDRLIMLAANASSIADIISFDIKRA